MRVIATAVAALIEAGVTGDALVAAIARMEEAQVASQQPTRTLRQERNARYYQNRKARSASSETSESVLNKTIETHSDEQKEGPHTPKKNTTPTNLSASAKKNRTKRLKPEGILCPDDFRPSAAHYAKCAERNAPASVADAACTKMHRWSHEHADREIAWKANWSLALHNFLDGELDKHERQAAARASPSGQKPSSHGPLARLADRMGIPDDRSRQSHASTDYGTVIDHAGDGSADRDLFKPSGGFSGRSEAPAYLSIVRAARG